MDPYLFCLILGFAGLAIMAASGLASAGGDHGGHGHAKELGGHHGHGVKEIGGDPGVSVKDIGHAHVKDIGHVHVKDIAHGGKDFAHHAKDVAHLDDPTQGDAGGVGDDITDYLFSLLSPRVFFSILVGAGAAGLLLDPILGGVALMVVAAVAGFAFEGLLVRPFWNFLFRFASTPAQTLDSALMDRATAVTGFDAEGQGVVSIVLDGQIVQLLGTLRPEDRHVRVRAGDALMVEDVDGRRNQCTVSWLGAGAPADGRSS